MGPRRWLALIIGFIGVLLIVRPGAMSFNLGSLFMLLSPFFSAFNIMLTRQLRTTDSSVTMASYGSLVHLVVTLLLVPLTIGARSTPIRV